MPKPTIPGPFGVSPNFQLHFDGIKLTKGVVDWFERNSVSHPWRDDWRKHRSPYHVWVSEIMLQQTLIAVVSPVYRQFIKRFPNLTSLARATEVDIREAVRGLGYYRRFRMLHAAATQLVTERSSGSQDWPTTFLGWKSLPGVGDYTAAAVGSIAFDLPVPVVDGNVERVLCRIFDLRMPPNLPLLKKQFFQTLEPLVCRKTPGNFNQGMMELGQTLCTSTKPQCESCPLKGICLAFARSSQSLAPAAKIRKQVTDVDLSLVLVTCKDRIGIYQRSSDAKFLKNTAGFATFFTKGKWNDGDGFSCRLDLSECKKVGKIKHHITNHNIRADVYVAHSKQGIAGFGKISWLSQDVVEKNLVSNLDRKAWMVFLNHGR